jgi:abequosyltransferase
MIPGSLNKVLNAIKSKYDLYLCESVICDFNMKIERNNNVFRGIKSQFLFDFSNEKDRFIYFEEARTSEAFFSYLGGSIFSKDLWKEADKIPESFYGTCWMQAGRFLSLMPRGLNIFYLGEQLIFKRGENDSFSETGIVNRLRISIEGFNHIAKIIFGQNSFEVAHINRVVRKEWPLTRLLWIKTLVNKNDLKNLDMLDNVIRQYYSDDFSFNAISHFIFKYTPISFINFLLLIKGRSIKKFIEKLTGNY